MKKLWLLAVLMLTLCPNAAEARARYQNFCGVGNQAVTIVGAGTSTTKWQLSAPSCTITVYLTGTATLASLYSNNSGTTLANPFTAQTNGMFYFYSNNGRYDVVMSGGGLPTSVTLGDVFVIDTASITPGSSEWSDIIDPTGNLALAMTTYTTAFTWGNLTGVSNALTLVDGAGSTSTGSLFKVATSSGSTMKPITFTAQGTANGVQMSNAGALTAIGTGSIAATTIACTGCITDSMINSITTRSKLPSAIAYEDEANEFTQAQVFDSTIGIKGGTGFAFTISGAPSANRNITIPDATSTLVNLASTQTLSGKTFSDDLVWTSGTAFTGTFEHANSANRVWTMPNSTGTLMIAPSLTSGSVIFTNGTVLTQDNAAFFWNTTTKSLGIGNASPSASLHVQPRATASQVAMRVQGNATANTDVLQVYNSAASPTKISYFGSDGALNTALTMTSTLATGASPLTVASTTKVANLNVDQLDGFDWAIPGTIGSTTPNTAKFTVVTLPSLTASRCLRTDASNIVVSAGADCAGVTWESLANGTNGTTAYVANNVADIVDFQFQDAFTTGNQFAVRQNTGNPTAGTLFAVTAADADPVIADFDNTMLIQNSSGTNTVCIDKNRTASASCTSLYGNTAIKLVGGIEIEGAILSTQDNVDYIGSSSKAFQQMWVNEIEAGATGGIAGDGILLLNDNTQFGESVQFAFDPTKSFSATPVFDMDVYNVHRMVLTNNVTSSTLTNPRIGQTVTIILCQDGTGGRTFVWPTTVQLRGGIFSIASAANACSSWTGWYQASNTTWYETSRSTDNPSLTTPGNCSDSAGDAACGSSSAGSVVVDAADTASVISTTAITANSQVFLQIDASLGTRLGVTCNTQAGSVFNPRVTARTAATSFTVTVDAGPTTDPLCLSYVVIN